MSKPATAPRALPSLAAQPAAPRPAAPAGLLYTILRHGRGNCPVEAARQQRQSLERGFPPAA